MGSLDAEAAIAVTSMAIAFIALWAAIVQVSIQATVEARRKGKTDKLALGDWAITWPQTRRALHEAFSTFGLKSPFGDPTILTVPFITIGALEQCLRNESVREGRGPLARRLGTRLVPTATESIASGGGRFSGRMYAVRATTRKRSESCWSDAMDMCGITRTYWTLMTGASALACDGAIRPANAVTNLHSLWGFARAMGLRDVEIQGTRITMTNGGASIYLDQYAGVDRPTRLAHFSGSPNGRYGILEEMSQQTAESVYADAVWSDGCAPDPGRLGIGQPDARGGGGGGGGKKLGARPVIWPSSFPAAPPLLPRSETEKHRELLLPWASEAWDEFKAMGQTVDHKSSITFAALIEAREPAVISCIRTYPRSELPSGQRRACWLALSWCLNHWWLDPYQQAHLLDSDVPSVPLPDVGYLSCEFVTGSLQASLWCNEVQHKDAVLVDRGCWEECHRFSSDNLMSPLPRTPHLTLRSRAVLVKVLQCWKLHAFCWKLMPNAAQRRIHQDEAIWKTQVLLLSMALVAVSMDSRKIGESEVNKALEIELG